MTKNSIKYDKEHNQICLLSYIITSKLIKNMKSKAGTRKKEQRGGTHHAREQREIGGWAWNEAFRTSSKRPRQRASYHAFNGMVVIAVFLCQFFGVINGRTKAHEAQQAQTQEILKQAKRHKKILQNDKNNQTIKYTLQIAKCGLALSGLEVGNSETVRSVAGIEHSVCYGPSPTITELWNYCSLALKKTHEETRCVF